MNHSYALQMHIHGSGSEGKASMLAHEHVAVRTGAVEAIWWTEHDWRLANCCKVKQFDFDREEEQIPFPARIAEDGEPPVCVSASWQTTNTAGDPPGCGAVHSNKQSYDGHSSLCLYSRSAAGEPQTCRRALIVHNHRASFPLFSRPRIRIAVRPEVDQGSEGSVFIECILSQQPPQLDSARICYVLADRPQPARRDAHDPLTIIVSKPAKSGQWNVIDLDPATDAAQLGLPAAGLDNALRLLQLGVTAQKGQITAYFDALELEPKYRGTAVIELQREIVAQLPARVKHFVGMEVSWYGQHINAFGCDVPIPGYEQLRPAELTTPRIIAHIHQHGGLACFNHPPVKDLDSLAAELIEHSAYGADLMEVAHRNHHIEERLQLWDRLSAAGVVLTGLGVSDAHHADSGWGEDDTPASWVTRIQALELEEAALLRALQHGRVFFADPSAFRGEMELTGPGNFQLGDVRAGDAPCPLTAQITGARKGDLLVWLANGTEVQRDFLSGPDIVNRLAVSPPTSGVCAVRLELRRMPSAGKEAVRIACSNPVYLAATADAISPCARHRVVNGHAPS